MNLSLTNRINPWFLLGSAGVFISFIGSYQVSSIYHGELSCADKQIFLFSITGILFCDYYIVQRGKIDLKSLYTAERNGNYWYTYGVNWRAMVAYVVGAAINFVGCKSHSIFCHDGV
jgi:NCS1 family nucleobase:cation symporter-1